MSKPTVSSSQTVQSSCTADSGKTFRCAQCWKYFSSKYSLWRHMWVHDRPSKCVCQVCSASFTNRLCLRKHTRSVHRGLGERYKCDICALDFAIKQELRQHERTSHSDADSWKCNFCPAVFNRKQRLHAHAAIQHAGTTFGCSRCPEAFRCRSECWNHIVKSHAPNLRNQFRCAESKMTFEIQQRLYYHMATAHVTGRPYHCPHCPATFKHRQPFRVHQLIHAPERPYCCAQCGARRKLRGELVAHLQTHGNDKPFVCHVCGYSARNSFRLLDHLRIHGSAKTFMCRSCGMGFKASSGRTSHEAHCRGSMSDQKQHSCKTCAKTFSCAAYLWMHRKRCRGLKKQFGCSQCPAAYEYRATLVNHLAIHMQKPRLIVCCVCLTVAKDTKALRRHLNYAHGKRQLVCAKCCQRFKMKTDLAKHISRCMASCWQCGFVSASSRRLKRHLRDVHMQQLTATS